MLALAVPASQLWLPVALLLGVAALAVAVWALTHYGAGARVAALEALRVAERAAADRQHAARQATARARVSALDLAAEPAALERLVADLRAAERARDDHERWQQRAQVQAVAVDEAAGALASALRRRGVEVDGDPAEAFERYRQACVARKRVAELAGQRSPLERQLADRERAEALAAQTDALRCAAATALHAAATHCGVGDADDSAIASALWAWQQERAAGVQAEDAARGDWARLAALLDGKPLADLARETRQRVETARRLATRFAPSDEEAAPSDTDLDARLAAQAAAARVAAEALAAKRGQVAERADRLVSVAEAEEAVAAAEADLDRLRRLDATLSRTIDFLERAQDTAHRDIAPQLVASVRRWLPRITGGRYDDVQVDPLSLAVRVRGGGGRWRDAGLLSHGTAEQVYLLLRVAMAEQLTRAGEVCPLLLDDVTVQSDEARTGAILDTLHQLSAERQVILFSQEADVLAWARTHLHAPRDRLEELDARSIGR